MPTYAVNKQARFNYEVLSSYTAGIVLLGHEVKSVRSGHINLKGSFATFKGSELYLGNAHISAYKYAGKLPNYEPERSRKLLLSKKEINKLLGKLQQTGLTLVPLKVYTSGKFIKVEVGLCKGRKKADKRDLLKKRDLDKQVRQELKYN